MKLNYYSIQSQFFLLGMRFLNLHLQLNFINELFFVELGWLKRNGFKQGQFCKSSVKNSKTKKTNKQNSTLKCCCKKWELDLMIRCSSSLFVIFSKKRFSRLLQNCSEMQFSVKIRALWWRRKYFQTCLIHFFLKRNPLLC